jgi:hypothetical protein
MRNWKYLNILVVILFDIYVDEDLLYSEAVSWQHLLI